MEIVVLETLSLFFHFLSFILGLRIVHKFKDILTRQGECYIRFPRFDTVEQVYWVIIISTICNLWFMFNQLDWMLNSFDNDLKNNVYVEWMAYHTGTGISVTLLHVIIHKLLKSIRKTKL